jgi:hypothetical protein
MNQTAYVRNGSENGRQTLGDNQTCQLSENQH